MTLSPYSVEARLDRIERLLNAFITEFGAFRALAQLQQEKIMAEIDDLIAEVTAVKTVEDSAVTAIEALVNRLNGMVQDATDLAALKTAVAAETKLLHDNAAPLADAIATVPPESP